MWVLNGLNPYILPQERYTGCHLDVCLSQGPTMDKALVAGAIWKSVIWKIRNQGIDRKPTFLWIDCNTWAYPSWNWSQYLGLEHFAATLSDALQLWRPLPGSLC